VSLLSSSGVPIEDIAALAGHVSTVVTSQVYRHKLRPALRSGAKKTNEIFPDLQLTET
jgi:transcriptional regulator GlxA family with amidase domain